MMSTVYDQLLGHKRPLPPKPGGAKMRPPPAPRRNIVFGVSPCPTGLAIAALSASRAGWKFDPEQSICLGLEGSEQRHLRQLARDFDHIAANFRIGALCLREPAGSGPSRTSAWTNYLVAMLLLTPHIQVEQVHPATIRAWRREMEPVLPRPSQVEVPPQLGNKLAYDLFDRAIECAAYVSYREARHA